VYLGGTLLGSFTPPCDASHVTRTQYSFTAPASTYELQLIGTAGTDCGVILDAVCLTPNP
jgi:hypothetical protein